MDPNTEDGPHEPRPARLGEVLYPDPGRARPSETEWVELVRATAAGDQRSLQALYERAHRIVFTLGYRITGSRETAEEVTIDVFHDVWRRSARYDPANGTVVGWIMNQTRSRAIDRLRAERRKTRGLDAAVALPAEAASASSELERVDHGARLRSALVALNAAERQAIETAFFVGLSYAETAARLNQPVGTVKTRIRSGLEKLRHALRREGDTP